MAGLAFIIVLFVSSHDVVVDLLIDVDVGCVGYTGDFQNLAEHFAACIVSNGACHF